MSAKLNSPENKDNQTKPKKLSPEVQSLKDEINTDMNSLINPIKASLDILLEVKTAWEHGLKECQAVRNQNAELKMQIEKVETENK